MKLRDAAFKLLSKLPIFNRFSPEELMENGLRFKYAFPFLMDKNDPIEGLFRNMFIISFVISALCLSVYFWYVTREGREGISIFAMLFVLFPSWAIATFYSKKLDNITVKFKENQKLFHGGFYVRFSFLAGFIAIVSLLLPATILDNMSTSDGLKGLYKYLMVTVICNYFTQIYSMEMIIIGIRGGIFQSFWIKFFWSFMFLYLAYKNI
jgi:hypothetical protein